MKRSFPIGVMWFSRKQYANFLSSSGHVGGHMTNQHGAIGWLR